MKWSAANAVVEQLRRNHDLWVPAISKRMGFSSSRVQWLLNGLVAQMPKEEIYFEVGTLLGLTADAAAVGNEDKRIVTCDPCEKYDVVPSFLPPNVNFVKKGWKELTLVRNSIGLAFYDGDHSAAATAEFMGQITPYLTEEAVLVLDDWDRESVRTAAFASQPWRLLREMPEYTDGLNCPPHHFGYQFGVALFGYRRS